jgi:hypothetical protein
MKSGSWPLMSSTGPMQFGSALSIAQPPLPHTIRGNVSFFGNPSSVVGRKMRWPGEPKAPSEVTLYGPGTASGAPSTGNARAIISRVMPAGWAKHTPAPV